MTEDSPLVPGIQLLLSFAIGCPDRDINKIASEKQARPAHDVNPRYARMTADFQQPKRFTGAFQKSTVFPIAAFDGAN
jgi:hypothetical protein